MKTNFTKQLLAAAAFFVAGSACAQPAEPPVAVNVDGLPTHVRERIVQEAQKGQTALIQYLHRTQTVHQLRPENVILPNQPAAMAKKKDETKVAERGETAKK